MKLSRYMGLFANQVRASTLLALTYRGDFLLDGIIAVFKSATALVPLFVVFRDRPSFAGWTFAEALLVTGWYTLLRGIIEGAISPSLTTVVDHIRRGTLDFVLLKPTDAQFLVSTSRFELWPVARVLTAVAIFAWAFQLMGRAPDPAGVVLATALLGTSTLLLYSLWILTVSAAFYVVKVDNLIYLFDAVFDAARWPAKVFRGSLEVLFTFVVPLALMTTFPAQAMLGDLPVRAFIGSVVGSVAFALFARLVWLRALGRYTSASS
jgi:ABC-2 type transport system permease protein